MCFLLILAKELPYLIHLSLLSHASQQYGNVPFPVESLSWVLVATAPAMSDAHIDAGKFCTFIQPISGSKLWLLLDPSPSPDQSKTTVGNQKIKRKLLREAGRATTHLGISQLSNHTPQALLKLQKHMSRLARCVFLRTKATTTKVWSGELGKNQQDFIADSGSDIALISQGALNQMEN